MARHGGRELPALVVLTGYSGAPMSGFHYTREAGELGQVLAREGTAPGTGLQALLERGRPPLRAALEISAAIADILCIAEEDRLIHGDLRPAFVKVDELGSVSVEGWGVARKRTLAPEGRADVATADMYGLGVVLHSVLSESAFGEPPNDPDEHDDAVIERVLAMDLRAAGGRRWVEDVRKFLCKILAWTPEDRPLPLDAANVLASVAGQVPGDGLVAWAAGLDQQPEPAMQPIEHEVLAGPSSLSAPMAKGGVRQAPSSKGESTSFWSREKIAQMLAEEDDEPFVPAPPKKHAPTPVFARESLAPPSPMVTPPPVAPPIVQAPPPPMITRAPPQPPEPPPLQRAAPPEPPRPTPVRHASEPVRAASPAPRAPITYAQPVDEDPFADAPASGGGSGMIIAGVVIVLLILVCGGIAALGGGYWFMGSGTSVEAVDVAPADGKVGEPKAEEPKVESEAPATAVATEPTPAAPVAPAPVAPAPKAVAPAPKPAAPATSSSATSTKTPPAPSTKPTTTKPPATPAPVKTPAPTKTKSEPVVAPASGPFTVKFSIPGKEGKVQCGDGQVAEFVGGTTMSFEGVTTCRVKVEKEKKQGVIQVDHAGTIVCNDSGSTLACGG